MYNKEKLKETELAWNTEEDIAVYFKKLHKEKERLEKVGINWDDSQKFTQAADKIYSSRISGEENMIKWWDKADKDKMWETCKYYFKELYVK